MLLSSSYDVFIYLLVVIKYCKLDIILFEIWREVLIQNDINFTMVIPKWRSTFAWLCKEVIVLNSEVDKCASNIVQGVSSFNCNSKFFMLIYCERIRLNLFAQLLFIVCPLKEWTDWQSHSHSVFYSGNKNLILWINWTFTSYNVRNIFCCRC